MSGEAMGQRSMIGALALLSTIGYGTLCYAQPLLAVAFERTYGWTRVQTSLALLTTAVLAPAVGRRLDLGRGTRWLSGGAWVGSLSFVVLACSTHYPLFVVG